MLQESLILRKMAHLNRLTFCRLFLVLQPPSFKQNQCYQMTRPPESFQSETTSTAWPWDKEKREREMNIMITKRSRDIWSGACACQKKIKGTSFTPE